MSLREIKDMKLHRFLKKNFWSESVFTLLFYTDLPLPLAPVHPLLAVDSVQSRHVKFLHSLQTSAWECWSKKNKKIKSWSTYCSSYITTATKKGKKTVEVACLWVRTPTANFLQISQDTESHLLQVWKQRGHVPPV